MTLGDKLKTPLAELARSKGRMAPVVILRDSERNTIVSALSASKGKVSGNGGAAQRLGLKRGTLE